MGKSRHHDCLKHDLDALDHERSLVDMVSHRLRHHTGPSFDAAWERLREGRPAVFMGKVAGTALGCAIMADGVYHIMAGADERVDDLFLNTRNSANHVRIFTGLSELGLGATMAYIAMTKGPMNRG